MKHYIIICSILCFCACGTNAKIGLASVRGAYPNANSYVTQTFEALDQLDDESKVMAVQHWDWVEFAAAVLAKKANLGSRDTHRFQTIIIAEALRRNGGQNFESLARTAEEFKARYPAEYEYHLSYKKK